VNPPITGLLLDFDGVLASYRRQDRVRHLAAHAQVPATQVWEVLYDSGLEARYDAGRIDSGAYLETLGRGLGRGVDQAMWHAARLAGTRAEPRALQHLAALDPSLPLAVLTNNGPLIEPVVAQTVGDLLPRLQGKILCSGQFGLRKPAPEVYRRALALLGWKAGITLFVDDLFVNVQGARAAGLQADSVRDARALGRVLKRYRLL
jgi:FMN phosphatase YigB (HAD superfamily)